MEIERKDKGLEMASPAWVSLFWGKYSKLPEPFKKVFFTLTKNIAKEKENQEVYPSIEEDKTET